MVFEVLLFGKPSHMQNPTIRLGRFSITPMLYHWTGQKLTEMKIRVL